MTLVIFALTEIPDEINSGRVVTSACILPNWGAVKTLWLKCKDRGWHVFVLLLNLMRPRHFCPNVTCVGERQTARMGENVWAERAVIGKQPTQSQVAERLGNWASNLKVASSIPGHTK